jgi:hypothetical protein
MPDILRPGGLEPLSLTRHGKYDQDRRKFRAKEEPMASVKEDDILVRDESFVKYERLLTKAETEGRIDGPKKCLVCGMRYMNKDEADSCCKINP